MKTVTVLDELIGKINPSQMKQTRDRMKLSARIDQLLLERKLSKLQFAKFMGKEPSVISKWLSGTHNFTTDTLSEISECLGVSLANLFEEQTPQVVSKSHFQVGVPASRSKNKMEMYGSDFAFIPSELNEDTKPIFIKASGRHVVFDTKHTLYTNKVEGKHPKHREKDQNDEPDSIYSLKA